MTDLAPDEKLCPYCAEVIKAAAIRCRYCQSDLPAPDAAPSNVEPVEMAPTPDVEPVETAPTVPSTPETKPVDKVMVGLLALCLVLAGALAGIVLALKPGDLEVADSGQVTDVPFRSAAMSAAAADATAILSYSYQTLDADQKAARELLTTAFAKQYESAMKTTAAKASSGKLTQKTTVTTTSLISITKTRATVLMFVNTVTTAAGSSKQSLLQNRVKMKLERKDGDWAVSDMAPF